MPTWDQMPSDNFLSAFDAPLSERQVFIRKTYAIFTGAIALAGAGSWIVAQNATLVNFAWQLSIVWIIAWYGLQFARPAVARAGAVAQYALLGALVFVVSMMTGPLVMYLVGSGNADILLSAFGLAAFTFGGLTIYVFVTKRDFSYIGGALSMLFCMLIGLMLIGLFVPFPGIMHTLISVGILVLACGILLYETSNILHHHSTDQAPLAAAGIFLAFVVIFWQLAYLLMAARD